MYFGKEQEELIREYIKNKDEMLYAKHIDPLLDGIAYGVRARYKFTPAAYYTSPSVINGCKTLLWEKLITNFDLSKNKKAFSYLTRIAHHYFCAVARKAKKSDRTIKLVASEADVLWEYMHAEHRDIESRMVDIDNSNIRKEFVREFLVQSFNTNASTLEAIMQDVDKLPNAHKKAVNGILHRRLWPNIKENVATKRIYRAKKYWVIK